MARILVVDDEEGVRISLRTILEMAGFEVAEAYDGRHALEVCRTWSPDLIITDMHMPHMGGVEALIELRKQHLDAGAIVIGARNDLEAGDLEALGVGRSFDKPFRLQDLLEAVREILKEKS